ncbi:DNA-binding transcriptional regulator, AcrR family [Friedmanniella luteola]|uniref:DNA-binding transcriptional regulator, AcrR family n=1 Tax=Friedmanniella luteola TaxID=546871 RepID=A0A1H1M2U3_9ACTN|nr:TetR/AcrR family transcriptional regulator [Friedmanniella luteola]SDR80665.1 DNA-binding transcriptional regulator, AcrR family [Friedmanniella luteola]
MQSTVPAPPAPVGPRRLTPRQRQLQDGLVELVLAEGFSAATVEDVAARLGCSKRTLYALADSKEQLALLVVRQFFRRATAAVEEALAGTRSPARRVTRYLEAVAEQLRAAGPAFRADVAAFAPAAEVYEQNTAAAAARVRELIDDGIRAGAFRRVPAAFVGEVVTATMRRITSGEIGAATGLDDAQAYAELARLVVAAISR